MMRRIHSIILLFVLLIGGAGMNYVQAATYSGTCGANGNNVIWSLNTSTGVLTLSADGVERMRLQAEGVAGCYQVVVQNGDQRTVLRYIVVK